MKTSTQIDYSETWTLFCSKGDNEAFSILYHNYYEKLYYLGLKFTSDTQTIEDSIQNIFIYLLKNRKTLKPVKNVGGYLFKSFRHQLFLELEKQKNLFQHNPLAISQFDYYNGTGQSEDEFDEESEIQTALKKIMVKLSAKQQEIIYLRYDSELSYEDIAVILGISVESCYKSVYRSIKIIKADLEKLCQKEKKATSLVFIPTLKKIF